MYMFSLLAVQFLRAELGNRAYLGTLASNSINVVNLVEDLYRVRFAVYSNNVCM